MPRLSLSVLLVAFALVAPSVSIPTAPRSLFGNGGHTIPTCSSKQYLSSYNTCASCPAGYACNGTSRTPCGTGSYSTLGSGACTVCPAGFACASATTTSPEPCFLDTYAPAGSAACTMCPLGTWSWGGAASCTPLFLTSSGSQTSARARARAPRHALCPAGFSRCPILGGRGGFECVDTQSALEACGGCAPFGAGLGADKPGRDCSAIEGAESVGCEGGRCVVGACSKGWSVAEDGEGCVESGKE